MQKRIISKVQHRCAIRYNDALLVTIFTCYCESNTKPKISQSLHIFLHIYLYFQTHLFH